MNSYKILYKKPAEKYILKNKLIGLKFMKAFSEISTNIDRVKLYDIKKFHHNQFNDIFRLRIGKYRSIFRIVDDEIIIIVFDIDSRGDIYK